MDTQAIDPLEAALAALKAALCNLNALRRAALYGDYDPQAFDRAVVAYREAEHEVQVIQSLYHAGQQSQVELAPAVKLAADEPPPPPIAATPQLLFARWLYERGYISEG